MKKYFIVKNCTNKEVFVDFTITEGSIGEDTFSLIKTALDEVPTGDYVHELDSVEAQACLSLRVFTGESSGEQYASMVKKDAADLINVFRLRTGKLDMASQDATMTKFQGVLNALSIQNIGLAKHRWDALSKVGISASLVSELDAILNVHFEKYPTELS